MHYKRFLFQIRKSNRMTGVKMYDGIMCVFKEAKNICFVAKGEKEAHDDGTSHIVTTF